MAHFTRLAVLPVLFVLAVIGCTSTAQDIYIHTPLTQTRYDTAVAINSVAYYDYGKVLALGTFRNPPPADVGDDDGPFPTKLNLEYYRATYGSRTIYMGPSPPSAAANAVEFMVGVHDSNDAMEALNANDDLHIFAPTFNEEALDTAPDPSRWTFTHPSLRTEAAAMLWRLYKDAGSCSTVAVVTLDKDDTALVSVAEEMAQEVQRRGYTVTRVDVTVDMTPSGGPYDVALLVGTIRSVIGQKALQNVSKNRFASRVIASNYLQAPLLSLDGLDSTTVPPITCVSHTPFALDETQTRFKTIYNDYVNATAKVDGTKFSNVNFFTAGMMPVSKTKRAMALIMAGFMDMKAFLSALSRVDESSTSTAADFVQQVHNLFTLSVRGEWLIGPFTGKCAHGDTAKARLEKLGLACNNSQGGRRLAFVDMAADYFISTGNLMLSASFRDVEDDFVLPVNSSGVNITAGTYTPGRHVLPLRSLGANTAGVPSAVGNAFPTVAVTTTSNGPLFVGTLPSTDTDDTSSSSSTITGNPTVLFVDPVDPSMTLRHNHANVLYLASTVEQDLHALAGSFLDMHASTEQPTVRVYTPENATATTTTGDSAARPVYDAVVRLLASHGITVNEQAQWANSHVFVLGEVSKLLEEVKGDNTVQTNTETMTLWMPYDALARNFDGMDDATGSNPPTIYFASSLPLWDETDDETSAGPGAETTQSSDALATLRAAYLAAVPSGSRTPAAMKAFYVLTVLHELTQSVPRTFIANSDVAKAVYPTPGIPRQLRTDSVALGPYVMSLENSADVSRVIKNYGAQAISVWTLGSTTPTTAATAFVKTTFVRYTGDHYERLTHPPQRRMGGIQLVCSDVPRCTGDCGGTGGGGSGGGGDNSKSSRSSTALVIGVSVGCGGLAAILVAVVVVYCCCYRGDGARNNANAPKDETRPVTLLFTDIQSSTALWALAPQQMADALAAHHAVIRRLIAKHNCYEVKTVGDAFMIASSDAFKAVLLARDIQLALYQYDWHTARIDELYRTALCKPKDATAAEPVVGGDSGGAGGGGSDGSDDAYAACWNGLRVRIGVHTGIVGIVPDPVTKGYDYYGDTANTAARTEQLTNGGQVLLTHFTVGQLTQQQLDELDLLSVGHHYLRGVADAVPMFQLNSVGGRVFAPIVTSPADAEVRKPKPQPSQQPQQLQTPGHADHASIERVPSATSLHTQVSQATLESTRDVLQAFYSPYSVRSRIKLLRKLAKHLGLTVERRPNTSDAAYADDLIDALSMHTSRVVDVRRNLEASLDSTDTGTDADSVCNDESCVPREGDLMAVCVEKNTGSAQSLRPRRRGSKPAHRYSERMEDAVFAVPVPGEATATRAPVESPHNTVRTGTTRLTDVTDPNEQRRLTGQSLPRSAAQSTAKAE